MDDTRTFPPLRASLSNKDFRLDIDRWPKDAMIITDPPYNIGFTYNEYKDKLTDDEYISMIGSLKGFKLSIINYPEETMKYYTCPGMP